MQLAGHWGVCLIELL